MGTERRAAGHEFAFITLGDNVPSTRFRFFPYVEPLRQRGHACRVWTSYPSVYDELPWIGWRASQCVKQATRWWQLIKAGWFQPDTIYLERGCFHDASLTMDARFRRRVRRLVLDVDDAVFLTFPEKIPELIRWSDHVIVSNRPLRDWVSQYTDKITEIPTCVPLSRFTLRPNRASEDPTPTIGWIGTTSNLGFLRVCASALRRLAKEQPFRLLVVAPTDEPLRSMDLEGVSIQFERWSPSTEVGWLHRMDIGIMPLPEGQDWMRYKAATKLVQYMAIGIPAVASPIGVNADILTGERVGMAARTEDEWLEALRRLLQDPELRARMGAAGRQLVESRYCIEANVDLLERVLSPE
jgi:glycosyltransferase involved in cell wall biosynthesis